MQKLTMAQKDKGGRGERGSVLVTVVVFSVLMGISGATYLTLTTNSVNREVQGLHDAKAFAAAESGLLMGTQWLAQQDEWTTILSNRIVTFSIDGLIRVDVDCLVNSNDITVLATAETNKLNYKKTLAWNVRPDTTSGGFGYFVYDAYSIGGVFQGLRNQVFNGPFHSNHALKLFNPITQNVRFNGPVSLYNSIDATGKPLINDPAYPATGGRSDYSQGVMFTSNGSVRSPFTVPTVTNDLDIVFTDSYDYSARELDVELAETYDVTLPVSGGHTLQFREDGTTAQWSSDGGSSWTSIPVGSDYHIHANFDLTVLNGSTLGKITVSTGTNINTGTNYDLYVDLTEGHLTYRGKTVDEKNLDNYGVGTTSDDVLALYSAGDIKVIMPSTNKTARSLTAQLFAKNAGGTFAISERKNGDLEKTGNKEYFTLVGGMTINKWWDEKHGGDEADVKVLYDSRALSAPGIKILKVLQNGKHQYKVQTFGWTETNTVT